FTSPGTDTNHFLDVLAAATLLFGDQLTRAPRRARLAVGVPAVIAGLTAATWIPGVISVRSVIERDGRPQRREVADIAARLGPASDGAGCYGDVLFPPGFLRLLEKDYVLSFVERPFVVYTPRRGVTAEGIVRRRADPPGRRVKPSATARSRPGV